MPVIEKLDALARTRTDNEAVAVIDKNDVIHMAHMDIHFTHSTNGVAALHTEILKTASWLIFISFILKNSITRQTASRSAAGF